MANTSGHTKKLTVNALVFIAYCIANIIAPQMFRASQAPTYTTGYNCIIGFEAGAVFCIITYGVLAMIENKRRDREYKHMGLEDGTTDEDLLDLTDKVKPGFRYVF